MMVVYVVLNAHPSLNEWEVYGIYKSRQGAEDACFEYSVHPEDTKIEEYMVYE